MKLYVVPHTHIDMEWYWTIEYTKKMMPGLFYDAALKMLRDDDDLCFAQDQAEIFRIMLENASEDDRRLIADKIQKGRLEPVGGMYVQPEFQEPCGEAMIRQMQIGQAWMKKHLGRECRCAWNIDSFGQMNQLPQLLSKCGYESLVFMRDVKTSDDPETFPSDFLYEGPDGTKIMTHWLRNTYVVCESKKENGFIKIANTEVNDSNAYVEFRKLFSDIISTDTISPNETKPGVALLLWGDDLYSLQLNTKQIKNYISKAASMADIELSEDDIIMSTPSEFFSELKKYDLPVRKNDFATPKYLQDLRATYVSRIGHKIMNRRTENALLSLEALNAVAGDKELDITELWKPVLFNQFHDLMGGSCLDENYMASISRYEKVLSDINVVKKTVLEDNKGAEAAITAEFNPTQFEREGLGPYEIKNVMSADADPLCIIFDSNNDISDSGIITIENEYYSVSADVKFGNVVSIICKNSGEKLTEDKANVIVAMEENGPDMEGALCLNGIVHRDDEVKAERIIVEKNNTESRITVRKPFLDFELKKVIVLKSGENRVDFETDVLDYTGKDYILSTEFTGKESMIQNACEVPFAIEKGRDDFNCAQRWTAIYDDMRAMAILNRGTCGYWVNGNQLKIALLRGYSDYWLYYQYGLERGFELFNDGKNHTSLAAEKGNHHFEYALVGGEMSWAEITAEAEKYDRPIEFIQTAREFNRKPIIKKVELPFIVTYFAKISTNTYIIRGYNDSENNQKCTLEWNKEPVSIKEVDLRNNVIRSFNADGYTLEMDLRPFEIVTLLIEE